MCLCVCACKMLCVTTHLENLEKSGSLTLVREKSEELGKVRKIVVCLGTVK